MTVKRYASEAELLADMLGSTKKSTVVAVEAPAPEAPRRTGHYGRRAATADAINTHAEIIAQLFEDPELSPNLVVWRQDDDPLHPTDWRKAAKRAGKLLNRTVTVFSNRGRMTAVLEPNDEERALEIERLSAVMDAMHSGEPMPAPIPRNYRTKESVQ